MRDIALGMQEHGLKAFAASVNASFVDQWKKLGLYAETEESWGRAFLEVLTKTLSAGGRFHFNLTGLDIVDALNGDPEIWVDGHTAWELRQIVRNPNWFRNTLFYLDGNLLTPDQVMEHGIYLQK
jgi:hypothetical protein